MPTGDRTGPWGLGPRTGQGRGYCSGFQAPGFMFPGPSLSFYRDFGFGRGFGKGMGLGRGRGFWRSRSGGFWGYPYFPLTPSPPQPRGEDEAAWLADQAKILEQQLLQVQEMLTELKKEKEADKDE